MKNEDWVVEKGGSIIEKKANRGVSELSTWERLVYCLWVVDYSVRNAGDLKTAADIFPNFKSDGVLLANSLNLPKFLNLLSLDDEQFLDQYYDRFDEVCNEIRKVETNMPHPMVTQIIEALQNAADPEIAKGMQAYMKTTQPFYGVKAGPRRKSFKQVAKNLKGLTREEYVQVIFELWNGANREEMYQALEVAEHYKAYRDVESWPIYDRLVKTATHWDTLDWIAGKIVSSLVLKHRELETKLVEWSQDDNFWVRRASLLAHLHHKEQTNKELLADTILALTHEQEFFIRKAIGWILRDYSYANPEWVEAFVNEHETELSGLSKREALKQINRSRKSS